MSRLSREKKRSAGPAVSVVTPLDVRVPGAGAAGATIGGVPVAATADEEIQHAVLRHLHRIALATGHPVLATIHDARIGYVVPLRVDTDGSSHFSGEPVRVGVLGEAAQQGGAADPGSPAGPVASAEPVDMVEPGASAGAAARTELIGAAEPTTFAERAAFAERGGVAEPVGVVEPFDGGESVGSAPSAVLDSAPTFRLRAVDVPVAQDAAPAPGTVFAPTGVFGPPPAMDGSPEPAPLVTPTPGPVPDRVLDADPDPAPDLYPVSTPELDPDPKPTPARGFDAVAEAVLGEDPRTLSGKDGAPALLGESVARVNAAVRAGRIDDASRMAERTVVEASGTLGPEHPEVLRLRELTAYIAYLAGDPLRAFHVSVDLAGIYRRAGDAEAAYGNVQSAASAWRAVRDPFQGLNLGTELLGLWSELAAEEGSPAAEDTEPLESARARMLRLANRARAKSD